MKRLVAIAASITVAAAGLAAVPAATASPGQPARPGKAAASTPSYTPPPLSWSPCPSGTLKDIGAECSTLVVPLDYAGRTAQKIHLAVSRVMHRSSAADYQGVMLANPGGPGGSGPGAVGARLRPDRARQRRRRLRLDRLRPPRRRRQPPGADAATASYFGYDRPNYVPVDRPAGGHLAAALARYAARLQAGGRAPAAQPREDHRLGQRHGEPAQGAAAGSQINFYGFSYGTYLGQVYATLYPNRVRRMVLDGNVDPTRRLVRGQPRPGPARSQQNIEIYFGWLAKHDDVYHLGTRRRRRSTAATTSCSTSWTRHPAGGMIGPDELHRRVARGRLLRLRLGGHRPGVSPAGQRRRRRGHQGDVRRRQPADRRRRQRLRDLPGHPVHRRARGRRAGASAATTTGAPSPRHRS